MPLVERNAACAKLERLNQVWYIESKTSLLDVPGQLRSLYIADATGRASAVGRMLGAHRVTFDHLACLSAPITSPNVVCSWTEAAEDGWWNACCNQAGGTLSFFSTPQIIRQARREMHTYLQRTRHLQNLFSIPKSSQPYTTTCASSRLMPAAGAGWLAVGDAAFTVQPLASAGVSKALRDARLAPHVLQAGAAWYEEFQATDFGSLPCRSRAPLLTGATLADQPILEILPYGREKLLR